MFFYKLTTIAALACLAVSTAAADNLASHLASLTALVSGHKFSAASCVSLSSNIASAFSEFDPARFRISELRAQSESVIEGLWKLRLALHARLREFHSSGRLTAECANAIRRALVEARALEDYSGSLFAEAQSRRARGEVFQPLEEPHVLLDPGHDRLGLRSGDLILSRGAAVSSAAIARLGDIDAQFSHLAVVYIDPTTKSVHTVEAHIEIGSVTEPFSKYISDGKVRAAVFRHPDATLAHRAAAFIYERVHKATAAGANIEYDFALDGSNHEQLFCTESGCQAYKAASGGALVLPYVASTIHKVTPEFLERLGIKAREAFLPGDLEVDPRFELVAEWRNFSAMRDSLYKDAIVTALYDWMGRLNYRFTPSATLTLLANALYYARRAPACEELLKKRFPLNMPARTLETQLVLDKVAGALMQQLASRDLAYRSSTGVPMTLRQLLATLEELRAMDQSRWSTAQGSSLFHAWFSPAVGTP